MLETRRSGDVAPADLQALRRIDAALLEGECGVRPGRGESAMKYVPKPLLKGWRQGVHWRLIEDAVYLSSALVPRLRERIQAVQAAGGKRTLEQVMDARRRRELEEDKQAQEKERVRLARASGEYVRPRRRDGAIYVPVKDRS